MLMVWLKWVNIHNNRIFSYSLCTFPLGVLLCFLMLHGTYHLLDCLILRSSFMQPEVANALAEAANLLLVGMVVVFLFLSMLIGAVTLIAWINRLIPDESLNTIENQPKFTNSILPDNRSVSPKVLAAISAAIFQHRQSH
jgi:oxaloacetate decarboxylase gamma subunit